jgi:hypothetical protein
VDIRTCGIGVAAAGVAAQLLAFGDSGEPAYIVGSGLAVAGLALAFVGPWIYGSRKQTVRPASRLLRVGAPFWLIGLLGLGAVAASGSTAGDDRAPVALPGVTTHLHGPTGIESANGTSPCEQSGFASLRGEAAGGHGHPGPVAQQAIRDPATRTVLAQQLEEARTVALSFPTVADAEKAGYRAITTYLPCIGAHYINGSYIDHTFDPAHPEMLLYDGTAPDSRIVGLSYYVVTDPKNPPEGFAGPNDPWHRHIGLCIKDGLVIGDERWSRAACRNAGGVKVDGANSWMVHTWVVPGWESAWGTFSSEHPELGKLVSG